ncbi:2-amino-4-hydroxy-6-hydroxymethyldihydropteridine diphosphokinase [Patescibacteria group bacterium]|nr:2-amino-4-hydroxy-6-hydroxymethyldihydropteridine diphosphokinase [Patescibacteria group bacterium]MBU1683791.1 2-amino-4-hydroxy-6-hydroxymethyldihydropteridine diphosphokinase [Patescibacteria group bacterium]MBU1935596.1 2-amino-4-hydroxy-6-hydroxymethyldihydropteridine diphosphokinase [Patescibacteria group bacterium]
MQKESPKIIAYLSIGSNMGDRLDFLDAAKEKMVNHPDIEIITESQVYETEPWMEDGEHPHSESGKDWFLNQVLQIKTSLQPNDLLREFQTIEQDLGRTKKHDGGPREIDIDILLYNEEVIDLPELQIPHRHIMDRRFVLEPLVELDSGLKDPRTGQIYKYILDNLEDDHEVTPFL